MHDDAHGPCCQPTDGGNHTLVQGDEQMVQDHLGDVPSVRTEGYQDTAVRRVP